MSMVVKEYRCSDCNRIFDSNIPSCIHCGSINVTRIFTQPFAFKSEKTRFSDDNLEHLTSSYNLDDFSNNESTKHTPDRESKWIDTSERNKMLPMVAGGSIKIDGPKADSRQWRAQVARQAHQAKLTEKKA